MQNFSKVATDITKDILGKDIGEDLTYTQKLKLAVRLYRYYLLLSNQTPSDFNLEDTKENLNLCLENLEYVDILPFEHNESDNKLCLGLLEESLKACGDDFGDLALFEFFDNLDEVSTNFRNPDFYIDTPSGEVRCIEEDSIEEIHEEYLEDLLEECYNLKEIEEGPIVVDKKATIQNMKGDRGPDLSGYDGEEHSYRNYFIYRVN